MCTFAEIKTKKDRLAFIKEKLRTDDRWLIKGLITIFDRQTADEQRGNSTHVHNSIGFSRFDATLLSSLAHHAINKGARSMLADKSVKIHWEMFFSQKQEGLLRVKMQKYAGQLARIANENQPIVKKTKVSDPD